jgi:hypothetical protein
MTTESNVSGCGVRGIDTTYTMQELGNVDDVVLSSFYLALENQLSFDSWGICPEYLNFLKSLPMWK